MPRCYS